MKWIDRQLNKLTTNQLRDAMIFVVGLIIAIVVFNVFG